VGKSIETVSEVVPVAGVAEVSHVPSKMLCHMKV
jgi:hypothetical protein